MQKITIFCCLLLTSCCSRSDKNNEITISDLPVKPSLVQYTNGPILKKVDQDYLVTKELVTNATLLTDYYKRIEKWKETINQ